MRCLIAKGYAHDEWLEAKRSTERIGITVGALSGVAAPKALVYFGDNLRQKAGLHFLRIPTACGPESAVAMSAAMIPSAAVEFDAVTKEAVGRGVHIYTIQAEGITSYEGFKSRTVPAGTVALGTPSAVVTLRTL
jgi:hypothetical protein